VVIVLIFILARSHAAGNKSSACWRPCWEDASSTKSSAKVYGWSCSSQIWHPPWLGRDCLYNYCRPGVVKLFDPRAEFATAWPPEDQIQRDLRDSQQLMLLHCCRQSETWNLKKMCKVFGGSE